MSVFHGSYLQTYLERDLRTVGRVANLPAFERFLRLAAARIGQLLNLSDLARDAQIAPSTAREWMGLLEQSFQVYLLRPYYRSIGKRQIKTPKLYFLDTGLASYLTGWPTAETAMQGAMAGGLLANYAIVEIVKSYWHRGREAPLWFWRTKEKAEVDLLIEEEGKLFPVEIKMTMRPDRGHLRGIERLRKEHGPFGPGALLCLVGERFPVGRDVDAVPVSSI